MCSPVGVRILLSAASLFGWPLSKLDVKMDFFQTRKEARDVYLISPRQSEDREKSLWLLPMAAYGLINSNAKWQVLSDQMQVDLLFVQASLLPQLFLIIHEHLVVAMIAKIVDDLLLTCIPNITTGVIKRINYCFTLDTITQGLGISRYFGLNITQLNDMTITFDVEDKLLAIEAMRLSRFCRRQHDDTLNYIDSKSFASLKSIIGWL